MMISDLTPGFVMMLGACLVPFMPHHFRQVFMLVVIALSAVGLTAGAGIHWQHQVFGQSLILHHADNLTLPFGIIFHLAALLVVIYGWHEKKSIEHTAGLAYAGAASAAVHAGDLITLFIWWELTTLTSVFLIFAAGTARANGAAVRYLLMQVASGVLLLAGTAFLWRESGSWIFAPMTLNSPGTWLLFLAFGIKAAFPLLNGWLQDSYPESTITGTVILSVFTTKMAIYALARGFPGTEILIWIGVVMVILPAIYALIENDLRRVLSYSLNNQLGFMIVAIGIGTEMAINGAVAHAFVSVLYKALLFMAVGAVMLRVGTAKATELGGLYKSMPLTLSFVIIGGITIAGVPLTSGYVAKSLVSNAVSYAGMTMVYMFLIAGSVAAVIHTSVKIPYFTFFDQDRGHRTKEAPVNMLVAMGATALLCLGIGVYPAVLYDILPYAVDYQPYYSSAVVSQFQLVLFAVLCFALMMRLGLYPRNVSGTALNSNWVYHRLFPSLVMPIIRAGVALGQGGFTLLGNWSRSLTKLTTILSNHPLSGPVIPGPAALVQVALLGMILGVIYAALA
jgi:multicomponent Na+:H+ antiporter subunit D